MRTLLSLRRFLPLFALLCFFVSACKDQNPAGVNNPASKTVVSGSLTDELGNIVPGAVVEALSASDIRLALDTTNDQGAFSLSGVTADPSVKIRISHGEFKTFTSSVQELVSSAGGNDGIVLHMSHADSCCARLTIQVSGGEHNTRLGGVEVRLRRGNDVVVIGTTDSNGRVTFTNICNGEFNLRIAKTGYTVVERGGINVHGCDSTLIEFHMNAVPGNEHHDDTCCNGKLRIVAKDSASGASLSGASIRINKTGGNARTLVSNGDGAIFREVCAGTYNVRIVREGYRTVEFTVTVTCNDSVYTDRRLGHVTTPHNDDSCCHGRATIIARDSTTNAVLSGATVRFYSGGTLRSTSTANGDGRVVLEGLCAGTYTIDISKDHYHHVEFTFTIGCNGTYETTRKLLAETTPNNDSCCHGRATIIARDSTTNAVLSGASVRLSSGGTVRSTTTTNGDGRVVLEGLCAGTYTINITKDHYHAVEFTFTIGCNGTYETTRKLLAETTPPADSCCNGSMTFRVKDSSVAEGGWLSGVNVTIVRNGVTVAQGTTNADGNYTRNELCGHATFTVTYSKSGFHSKTVTFTMTDCRAITETIRIVKE
ncbi:MAG: Cna protein B-type domain protein [Chlorobi bacterium]|nr:Cna protein B-type domain protein [Chlorobiota bacterium]